MPKTAFDNVASTYDQTFTQTVTGKLQRQLVWDHLEKTLPARQLKILEINCGTGEDAVFLAEKGHIVTATDASLEMIAMAKDKRTGLENLTFSVAAFDELPDQYKNEKFDLIFSNFGGLNCISPEVLQHLLYQLHRLLSPEGKLIAVMMGKFCLLETIYFLMKGKLIESFRRIRKEPVEANVGGEKVLTWYYSPGTFFDMAKENYCKKTVKAIGVAIPPSYLDPFYKKHPKLLAISKKADNLLAPLPFSSHLSDRYLIELERVA